MANGNAMSAINQCGCGSLNNQLSLNQWRKMANVNGRNVISVFVMYINVITILAIDSPLTQPVLFYFTIVSILK